MNDDIVTLRTSFDPPPPRGLGWSFLLALLAHVLLIAAIAWGLRWKKDAQDQAVSAELWNATAQTAAPQAPPPPPPPPPAPEPKPQPKPVPPPPPQVDDDTAQREADLALAQKKRQEAAARKAEQDRLRQQQQAAAQAKADQQAALAKADAAKKAAEKASAAKAAQEQKIADQKAAAQKAAAAAKADAINRQNQLARLSALASADDQTTSTANTAVSGPGGKTPGGRASRDAGPSAGYASRVRARVFPNITYPDLSSINGNPDAEVQVTAQPDGTIINRRLIKSSGIPSWDQAVLRAIDKTQTLPRDVDGRVPSPIIIEFTPH